MGFEQAYQDEATERLMRLPELVEGATEKLERLHELVGEAELGRRYPDNFDYAAVPLFLWREILDECGVAEASIQERVGGKA